MKRFLFILSLLSACNAFETIILNESAGKTIAIVKAIARLQSPDGTVKGIMEFTQPFHAGAPTQINGTFKNLPEEDEFGIKILQYGNMTNGCLSMGEEFNPERFKKRYGPNHPNHWVGTLGNVKNQKYENTRNHKVSLFGHRSVIGRGVVLYENRDDGGVFSTFESQSNGNVGRPVACGIIGLIGTSFD
uniref:Superoxide dismutase n=1 Tax=Panagrellus redivivus TaxID=6233 RepID=A0A7E4UZX4_PANRE